MIITSLGIFGFLSDAYQDTKTKVDLYESKIMSTQNEIDNINKQINTIENARDAVDTKTSDTIETYKKRFESTCPREFCRKPLLTKLLHWS